MGGRIAPWGLSTRQGREAHRGEMGDRNVFYPVVAGLARGQQGFKVQAIEPTCDDEDAIAVVNQVLCRLYQHLVKIARDGMLFSHKVPGPEYCAAVACHRRLNRGAIRKCIEARLL